MTLPTNEDFANSELATSELETISGGFILSRGPYGGGGRRGGGAYHPPHLDTLPAPGDLSLLSSF